MKSLQWLQNVGCLKKWGTNWWPLTSYMFFCLRAPRLWTPPPKPDSFFPSFILSPEVEFDKTSLSVISMLQTFFRKCLEITKNTWTSQCWKWMKNLFNFQKRPFIWRRAGALYGSCFAQSMPSIRAFRIQISTFAISLHVFELISCFISMTSSVFIHQFEKIKTTRA